ncbi:hypothetical protein A8990_13140 [Paenibacillus taihuensis]|uniref:Uncharacterized protein n=1 Tax=Paenibacillus taihuensis TaxID=1156355 RepID=A0A3D9QWI0_9BACL|nr:hypothetical protein A8990_13140 [Paenibacillus taihuensis]
MIYAYFGYTESRAVGYDGFLAFSGARNVTVKLIFDSYLFLGLDRAILLLVTFKFIFS